MHYAVDCHQHIPPAWNGKEKLRAMTNSIVVKVSACWGCSIIVRFLNSCETWGLIGLFTWMFNTLNQFQHFCRCIYGIHVCISTLFSNTARYLTPHGTANPPYNTPKQESVRTCERRYNARQGARKYVSGALDLCDLVGRLHMAILLGRVR